MIRISASALAFLLAICVPYSLHAMSPWSDDDTSFKQVAESQNTAFEAGDFDMALELNQQMLELAPGIEAEMPGLIGMILYDRAVIQIRRGDTDSAIAILDKAYANGDLQAIGKAELPVDYYGYAMKTYVDALRDAERADWRTVQAAFVEDLFAGETGQTVYIAKWTNFAMVDLQEAGYVDEAIQLCNRQIGWFEDNPQAANARGIQEIGTPTIFVADKQQPPFVTGIAIREQRYEAYYAFMRADLEDTCGGIMEVAGDLESAVGHRRSSFDWVHSQNITELFKVIRLRLARALAFQGNDELASQYLKLALDSYRYKANGNDISGEVCSELDFVLDARPRSAAEVLQKFREAPLTAGLVDGIDCSVVARTPATNT